MSNIIKVIIFLLLSIPSLFAIDGSEILKELGEKHYQIVKGTYFLIAKKNMLNL